jgi:glycolate oxidase iron-sulfur subunit
MQTAFTLEQLAESAMRESERILRTCVHCGFCLATCPTYTLLGDERDSPRGRIYLIKDMLEGGRDATVTEATHLDRCLSCLSCMTTCPSGVNYMHLVDHGRAHVEATYRRPWHDRALRALLAFVLPRPGLFRASLAAAWLARPLAPLLPARLRAMLEMAPDRLGRRSTSGRPATHQAAGERRRRVALLAGCAQQVLEPSINESTIRLLTRLGCEVVVASGAGCCGALTHHLGREAEALRSVKANVAAWSAGEGFDAIVVNASGCGTTVKDYGFMLRDEPDWAERAAAVSARARDITEILAELGYAGRAPRPLPVAYHAACSLQHGQKITDLPKRLLAAAGFEVREPAEGHMCCGSAGTYNLLQPALARGLRDRKTANLKATRAALVAAGNIGCMAQITAGLDLPVVHTVELLDWASGGPVPAALVKRLPPP